MDKAQLLSARRMPVAITVPEWGKVFLRRPSLRESEAFGTMHTANEVSRSLAYLVCVGVCDEHGTRMFDDEDLDKILELEGDIAVPIAQAMAKMMGVNVEQVEQAKNE